jgi:membrane protein insertase Oxa1/YidC/SpoIIIJ
MAAPQKHDPNKYRKNVNIKPESGLNNMLAIGRFILMVIGIIGLAIEFFKEAGWLKSALAWLFQDTSHMTFIPIIILILWFINRWISSPSKVETKKSGNLPLYVMMGLGVYYLFRIVTTGGF